MTPKNYPKISPKLFKIALLFGSMRVCTLFGSMRVCRLFGSVRVCRLFGSVRAVSLVAVAVADLIKKRNLTD